MAHSISNQFTYTVVLVAMMMTTCLASQCLMCQFEIYVTSKVQTTGRPIGTGTGTECGSKPADIHFLVDGSGSIDDRDFNKALDFISKFADSFNIGPNAVRFGVTVFATSVHHKFWMNEHMDKNSLKEAITGIKQPGGNTYTGEALDYVAQNAFTTGHGGRDNANDILIILTDGDSSNFEKTKAASNNLHSKNISVFSIGVGNGVNKMELEVMASNLDHVFPVDNYGALNSIQARLKKTTCEAAGTDGIVYIRLVGERGQSTYLRLTNKWADNVDKEDIDTFNLKWVDIGNLMYIDVRFVPSSVYPSWLLKTIKVREEQTKDTYMFHPNYEFTYSEKETFTPDSIRCGPFRGDTCKYQGLNPWEQKGFA